MHLDPKDLEFVRRVLTFWAPGIPAFAYGSRVHGHRLKPHSDLDICLRSTTPIAPELMTDLRDAFANSRLGFRVDLSDWHAFSDDFRRAIEPDLVPLSE